MRVYVYCVWVLIPLKAKLCVLIGQNEAVKRPGPGAEFPLMTPIREITIYW